MIRVCAKVNEVTLRIKENIEVQITIRKAKNIITCQQKSALKNCQALFNTKMQFYIPIDDPTFNIEVILFIGSARKYGGCMIVDLMKLKANQNFSITQKLTSSPDPEGSIKFDVFYTASPFIEGDRKLMSTNQMHRVYQSQMQTDISNRNAELEIENARLQLIMKNLKKDNRSLITNQSDMNDYYEKNFDSDINSNQNEDESSISQRSTNKIEGNMDRMKELMNQFGSQSQKTDMKEFFDNHS